jgi:hypothetical protein
MTQDSELLDRPPRVVLYTEARFVVVRPTSNKKCDAIVQIVDETSQAIIEDIQNISRCVFPPATATTWKELFKQFLGSCLYYLHGILRPGLQGAKAFLKGKLSEPLRKAEDSLRKLRDGTTVLIARARDPGVDGDDIGREPSPGSQVPTASPYQLRYELFLHLQGIDTINGKKDSDIIGK